MKTQLAIDMSLRSSNNAMCKYNQSRTTVCILSVVALSIFVSQLNCQIQRNDCATRNRHLASKQHLATNQRQQRQFKQPVSQQQERSAPVADHEEFSLALGGGNQQQVSSNYTLLAPQANELQVVANSTAPPTNDEPQTAASTTPAMPSDSIGSPVAAQPPVTTSSSIAAPAVQSSTSASTTGISAITESSAPAQMGGNQAIDPAQVASAAVGRHEDTTTAAAPAANANARQISGGRMVGGLQPVSSSPSSISIITPLNGSPGGHAHITSVSASIGGDATATSSESPHSALMKPLLVLGNPISERDYQTLEASISKVSKSVADNQIESHAPQPKGPSGRIDKSAEQATEMAQAQAAANSTQSTGYMSTPDRMSGPPLVYSDGHLSADQTPLVALGSAQQQQAATPRLFHGSPTNGGAAVVGNNPRRPSLPPPVNQANAASGFRSPMSPSGPLVGSSPAPPIMQAQPQQLQPPVNGLMPNFYQGSPPYAGASSMSSLYSAAGNPSSISNINNNNNNQLLGYNKPAFVLPQTPVNTQQMMSAHSLAALPSAGQISTAPTSMVPPPVAPSAVGYSGRRPLNITRVEHISAECSNDLIKAVIVFNGTFKGIIYSSGYVSDPTCLYVNGTGSTRYEFHIRLNQCGTLGSEKLHHPTIPGEARRRDQVMFNTLSIQYNSIIEQEWDEHFKVSCEYGSDFWKTVSFSPFNVETNTGSPVVFTINPPQCQMDVLLGHGMGPKIVDGPVTVGDPLTLLIHMKSEKAGYDILVKNCVAHNGSKQKMQLIDSNGCVVNERFISPFRGTYNDNDLRHVTLYAYLKAFRFTGSPVLYLECEIHMCQSACPPQMCYWRRLSKRSVDNFDYEYTTNSSSSSGSGKHTDEEKPVISESLSLFKALQVRQEPEPSRARQDRQLQHRTRDIFAEDDKAALVCYRYAEVWIFLITIASLLALIITVAATCCWRFRKLSRSQFQHDRLASSTAGSLSPSLLSISDAISSAGSIIGKASMLGTPTLTSPGARYNHHHPATRFEHQPSRSQAKGAANLASVWHNQQQLQKQQCLYVQRQDIAPSPAYRSPKANCPSFQPSR